MSAETMKLIFDPFFTTRPDGTGLGLSIVQSLLSSYDCRLDVESQEGVGTAFFLKLKEAAPH
jgi:signal transduction histidine kinase